MLESWILIALNPNSAKDLPIFSKKSQSSAKEYYKKCYRGSLPNQLKDLCNQYRYEQGGLTKEKFFLKVAKDRDIDIDEVAKASSSFSQFRNQVDTW